MGVPLSELVDPDKLAALRAAVGDTDDLEEKKAPGPGGSGKGKDKDREHRGGGDDGQWTRDGIGRFASDGGGSSSGVRPAGSGGRPAAGSGVARAGDDPAGRRRTADGGVDRDGDGDSDPALGEDGFARIGDLDDLRRQIANWEDNVPVAKRAEQKERMLARAKVLGASPEQLARIRKLPAPKAHADGPDRKDDPMQVEWKDEPSRGIEHKADPGVGGAQVLSADPETGIVEALVSVTGVEDRVKDIIEPGAYEKTLALRDPIGVWSHDDKTWVARTEERREIRPGDPFFKGMKTMDGQDWPAEAGAAYVKARFNLETPHGAAAFSDVKFFEGKTGWSIGYRATKAHRNPRTGVRHIKELDWFEYSPVMVGAASQPMTLSVKSDAYSVDALDDTGLVTDVILTRGELAKYAELKASFGLEVKARVRTAEGASHYGQPIGSIIIPDAVTSVPASALTEGMSVDFQGMGPGGPSDPVKVSGKVEKVVKNESIVEVTVGGKTHKLTKNSPIDVDPKDVPDDLPLTDMDLAKMIGRADDDEEKAKIREAAGLPATKRRAFLTGGSTTSADDAAPAAGESSGGALAKIKGGAPASKMSDAELQDIVKTAKGDDARYAQAASAHLDLRKRQASGKAPGPHDANTPAMAKAKAEAMGRDGNGFAKDDPDRPLAAFTTAELNAEMQKVNVGAGPGTAKDTRMKAVRAEMQHRVEMGKQKQRDESPDGKAEGDARPSESVVDNVNLIVDDLRDAGDGDNQSELQQLLDDYDKDPGSDSAEALRDKLTDLAKTDQVRGDAIDETLKELDLLLEPADVRSNAPTRAAAAQRQVAAEDAAAKKPAAKPAESRNPEAARERDQRADRARTRAREEDTAADARVKERAKLAAYNKRRRAQGKAPVLTLPASMKSLDFAEHTDDELEAKVLADPTTVYGDPELEEKGSSASLDRSPRSNWVEKAGGLPAYFREVARSIAKESGVPLDRAIPMAIGRIKKWARGGGDVKPDTVVKAAAAVAQWEKMKASKGFTYDSELFDDLEAKTLAAIAAAEAAGVELKDVDEPLEIKAYTADGGDEGVDLSGLFARGAALKATL